MSAMGAGGVDLLTFASRSPRLRPTSLRTRAAAGEWAGRLGFARLAGLATHFVGSPKHFRP